MKKRYYVHFDGDWSYISKESRAGMYYGEEYTSFIKAKRALIKYLDTTINTYSWAKKKALKLNEKGIK